MNTQSGYFSIVSNRIDELRQELLQVNIKVSGLKRNKKEKKSYELEREFILRKISYLEKLINLPLFMYIDSLSNEDISRIQGKGKVLSKSDLINLFGLSEVSSNFRKSKIVTMAYIKDSFISDYDFMTTLLDLQRKGFDLSNRKNDLCSNRIFGFQSFKELSDAEVRLYNSSSALETKVGDLRHDYDVETLIEIYMYIKNPNMHLSEDFYKKHGSKINNPKCKHNKFSSFIRNKFNLKRSKSEETFLSSLVEAYKKDPNIRNLGLESIDFNTVTKASLKDLSRQVKKQTLLKQKEFAQRRKIISDSRTRTLKEFQKCDEKKKKLFTSFTFMLHSKSNYVPKIFEEQMWNEPDLKESLMREACYLEETRLTEEIYRLLNNDNKVIVTNEVQVDLEDFALKMQVA